MGYDVIKPCVGARIIHGTTVLDYEEIIGGINKISNKIKELHTSGQKIVGLLLNRSHNQILCMHAVHNVGCAYLPMNPSWPEKRIKYVINQSETDILIVEKELYESFHLGEVFGNMIEIDSNLILVSKLRMKSKDYTKKDDLAYIIYTSGTTGNPKGVAISMQALEHLKSGLFLRIPFHKEKVIMSLADYSFDMFVPEGLLAPSYGLNTVLVDNSDIINPRRLVKLLNHHRPDYMQITPSALKVLEVIDPDFSSIQSLSKLLIGAEALSTELLRSVKRYYKGKIYNAYGPTESTVWCTVADLTNEESVFIGEPLPACDVKIMDAEGTEVGCEVTGELFLSGSQLANEYWNNKKETSNKFILINNVTYYKTGDLGFIDRNGKLCCIGRVDDQVKINGYRIELLAVEEAVGLYCDVKSCMVAVSEEGQILIAFLVTSDKFNKDDFYQFLQKELPQYSIPARIVRVECLEYNYNGKADRKKMLDKYDKKETRENG